MFRTICGKRAAKMLDVLSSEGIAVDDGDVSMLCGYIRGSISRQDLLAHVHQFATLSSYQDWLSTTAKMPGDDPNSASSVEQVMAEFERFLRRKYVELPRSYESL